MVAWTVPRSEDGVVGGRTSRVDGWPSHGAALSRQRCGVPDPAATQPKLVEAPGARLAFHDAPSAT